MSTKAPRPPLEAVLAVALVSFTILGEEVALTRIFSVLFRAPYVFLIVSGAIGGLGLGGLIVQFLRISEARLRAWIVGLSLLLAAALVAPVLVLFASPGGRDLVSQAETLVVVALPMATFCVAGMLLSLILRRYSEHGGFLYFADLGAAALGAPIAVLLLNLLGGINTPLALGTMAAVVGLALALRLGKMGWTVGAGAMLLTLGGLLAFNVATQSIDLPVLQEPPEARNNPAHPWHTLTKPLYAELGDPVSGSHIVRTDWTAVSRTDVVEDPGQNTHYIYTDGDVPTQMEAWNGKLESARADYARFIGALPYHGMTTRPPTRVMAIGSGGGLDVLLALAAGAREVDAVEINPSIPRIVADPRFQGTYARVYREPGVRLAVDEGRSFLQRNGKYDVIYFACAKTATSQTGGVALLDNHLYTVEAFQDYWRHLSDDGILALVTQEPFLIDRLLVTATQALRTEGVPAGESGSHLLTARMPPALFQYGPYRHILLLRRNAWVPGDMPLVRRAIAINGLQPLFLPFGKSEGADGGTFDPAASIAEMRARIEAQYRIPLDPEQPEGATQSANLSPVTDDSPFYVDISHGLHPTLVQLLTGALMATGVVLLVVLIAGLVPPRGTPRTPGQARVVLGGIVYFAMLGGGFMLVELALMSRFTMLLGFPTRSLTVSLFALLVSGALGSMASQRGTAGEARGRLLRFLPLLVAVLLLYRFALPPVLHTLLPLPLWVRALASGLLLFPAGFLMGMPFPTGLRCLEGVHARLIPAFWSVNGVTSILGSVATMALAKFIGYSGALLVGAGCYVLAWFALFLLPGGSIDSANLSPKVDEGRALSLGAAG